MAPPQHTSAPVGNVPPCRRLGAQCRSIRATLRVGTFEGGPESLDHEATWLLGHTERIAFLELWAGEGDLYADVVIHAPCRHLETADGTARCRAWGYTGRMPQPLPTPAETRQLGRDRFRLVERHRLTDRRLPAPPAPRPSPAPPSARALPVVEAPNPCATAACRTSDHRRGAACCRDLQVEIMCSRTERRLEQLVRSRKPPYVCKVQRAGDWSIEAELISACAYLEPGGVNCTLHGRTRADGRPAKPELCSAWPERRTDLHPGCVFMRRRR